MAASRNTCHLCLPEINTVLAFQFRWLPAIYESEIIKKTLHRVKSMEFSPKHRKSSCCRCCVLNCTLNKSKNLNLSFHEVPKRDSERFSKINIFGDEEFVDKRSEWLRKLNIVDDGREFLVCLLHFRSENDNFLGKFIYTSIFRLNYLIIRLCVLYFICLRRVNSFFRYS